MDPSICLILDAGHYIFVWFGDRSPSHLHKLALETAVEYKSLSPLHNTHSPLFVTKKGAEPMMFRTLFQGMEEGSGEWQERAEEVFKDYTREFYSYEELISPPLPKGVDPSRLEDYLTLQEFRQVFSMEKKDFSLLPAWKRDVLKKEALLF